MLVFYILYADDPVGKRIKRLITSFISDILEDQQTGRDADCQTKEVEQGIAPALAETSDGSLEERF